MANSKHIWESTLDAHFLNIMDTIFNIKYSSILGPVLGSSLYSLGGFLLPFVSVGSFGLILALCLFFTIPSGEYDKKDGGNIESQKQKLTWGGIFRVNKHLILQ